MSPPSASPYSSDRDVRDASRTIWVHRRHDETAGRAATGSRTTSAASAATHRSAEPSPHGARRPPGSNAHDTAEITTAIPLPRLNTPSAKPRRPYPTIRDTIAAPTTYAVPATPATAPATTTTGSASVNPSANTATAASTLTAGNITRAPYRSVSTPTG